MDPIIAILALVLLTATVSMLFSLVRKRGAGASQAITGMALGWLLFLTPLYFFGMPGAIAGIVCIMLIGALMSYIGWRYDRGPARR